MINGLVNKKTQRLLGLLLGLTLLLAYNVSAQKNKTNPNGFNKFYFENGQITLLPCPIRVINILICSHVQFCASSNIIYEL